MTDQINRLRARLLSAEETLKHVAQQISSHPKPSPSMLSVARECRIEADEIRRDLDATVTTPADEQLTTKGNTR
jgi:hypothetical protein